jgi:hypothetical protein
MSDAKIEDLCRDETPSQRKTNGAGAVRGWRIVSDPPVRFRRAPGMKPLPEPIPGGSIEPLRQGFAIVPEIPTRAMRTAWKRGWARTFCERYCSLVSAGSPLRRDHGAAAGIVGPHEP